MKKLISVVLALTMIMGLSACGNGGSNEKVTINVIAAQYGQQTADFISIVAWRQTAEFVSRYFKKGKPILVCGALQSRSYTDSQGNKRYVTEVVADEVSFVESKGAENGGSAMPAYVPDAYTNAGEAPQFEAVQDDGDLPF